MRLDFARLNHILIPNTKTERDRFRRGRFGRAVLPIAGFWGSLTDEGRTLIIVTPIAGAAALDVPRTSAYVVFSVLAALLVGSLLAARTLVLHHAALRVVAPRRVTVGEEVTFAVTVSRDAGAGTRAALRVRGPFLPWDGTWTSPPPDELVVAPGERSEATMAARFSVRGMHDLEAFTVAIVAPLGLACGPRLEGDGVKVCVVPRIADVRRLPLAIGTKHQPGGVALASKAGESMDLLGVRPYRPGDAVRDLHARTWARTGVPAVREYQQEYFTRVGVVLDTGTRDPDLLEAAIELAAGVTAHLARGEALIDVLVVGDTVHELTLGRSLGRLDQALELLAAVQRGPTLDATRLVAKLGPHLAQLSSVVAIGFADGSKERPRLAAKLREHGVSASVIAIDAELRRAIAAREALAW
jgi:uncharacterized protein (DUF58 family)